MVVARALRGHGRARPGAPGNPAGSFTAGRPEGCGASGLTGRGRDATLAPMSPSGPIRGAARMSPPPRWLQAFLLLNVVQDFAIGVSGLLSPTHIVIPLKELTPLNARFIAALYLGGGVVILLSAFVRRAVDARIALYALSVITALVLLMTFAYWGEFTRDGIPWIWMFTYLVDPVIAPFAIVALGIVEGAAPGRHRLTALFVGEAAVFGGCGIVLLFAPRAMVDAWPWALTPLLARVYASFFLAFALGAALAAFDRRPAAIRPFLTGSLALLSTTLLVSLVHLSKFDHGPGRWLWFLAHAVGIALFALALATLDRGPGRLRAIATAEP